MNMASGIYVVCALLVTSIAWIAVGPTRTIKTRTAAVALVAALLPAGFGAVSELLSRPKPVAAEWIQRQAEEAIVVSSVFQEGEAIYLWLQLPNKDEPRAYTLPWDEQLARQLAEAEAEGEATEQSVSMKNPFKPNEKIESEPQFYLPPPPTLPPKTPVVDSPQIFNGTKKSSRRSKQSQNPS